MKKTSRRNFLKSSFAAGFAVSMQGSMIKTSPFSKIIGANEEIQVAIVGFHGKGRQHINLFHSLEGVKVVALCDPDQDVLNGEEQKFYERNEKIKAYTDIRKLLDDKNIDAIVVATPNHWHSLMTIWACQAGKDVYVEKPVSHNIWEGRKMVATAKKYKRIVQAGTQTRSDEATIEVVDYLQKQNLGKILLARGLCYKRRKSIGKVDGPQTIPKQIDYNLWLGPAPMVPLRRTSLHYDWHWNWDTGNGDIGNQGVHQLDMCRWILGQNKLPERVFSIGGRFGYDDDGETPNTQIAFYDYKPVPVIFEVRGLPDKKDSAAMDQYKGVRIGVIIHCENGYFAGSTGGGWIYDNKGNRIKQFSGSGGAGHAENFIKAMRSRKTSDLKAEIEEGHLSSALCHMANISFRLGHFRQPEEIISTLEPNVKETFARFQEHLFANWIDLKINRAILGPILEFDPDKEKFKGDELYGTATMANELLSRNYRKPFIVPEKI